MIKQPTHHLFIESIGEVKKQDKPFIIETSGNKEFFDRYLVEVNGQDLEIWIDQQKNIWFNKI